MIETTLFEPCSKLLWLTKMLIFLFSLYLPEYMIVPVILDGSWNILPVFFPRSRIRGKYDLELSKVDGAVIRYILTFLSNSHKIMNYKLCRLYGRGGWVNLPFEAKRWGCLPFAKILRFSSGINWEYLLLKGLK